MLKLRRGTVVSVVDEGPRVTSLRIKLETATDERDALAYPGLTGRVEVGDEVVVNTQAHDLGLGSGGFDIVHVNLTRGLAGEGAEGAHVMKLNYTPLQHAVHPMEEGADPTGVACPVAILALHGQLAPAVFAASKIAPHCGTVFVQTAGGALPGQLSDVVAELFHRGNLENHVTVAPCFGGMDEAITVEGALDAGSLSWESAFVGPGPGILGSASPLGHGGLEALHSAHAALAIGSDVMLVPRVSAGDARSRHRGLSHHTRTVLELLLRPVSVAVPSGIAGETRIDLEQAIARGGHKAVRVDVDGLVDAYRSSGLPTTTMGRSIDEDEEFFRAALAAGAALAQRVTERR